MTAPLQQRDAAVADEFLSDFQHAADIRIQDAADPGKLGIVLGADSLLGRRSGIGRVAIEIAQRLGQRPEIGDHCFLVRGRLCVPRTVWEHVPVDMPRESVGDAEPARSSMNRRIRARLGRIEAVRRLYELKLRIAMLQEIHQFRARTEGRLVYYEPNFIAFPFDGVTVVEINDLSWRHYRDCHPAERIDWIEKNLQRTLKQARRFVAISNFTANALADDFGIDRDRIDVVPLAPASVFRPIAEISAAPVLARYGLHDRRYILSVSTLGPRKNFDRLLVAHRTLPQPLRENYPLVISGGVGWGGVLTSPAAEEAIRDGSLRLLGHISDPDLATLMARCTGFAYVSLYEGFGLPVIEAMATGAAVIASKTTAVGETAGDAALRVDPLDEGAIGAAMRRVIEDRATGRRLGELGLGHAANFSWDNTMTGLIRSWRRALADD